MPPEKKRKTPKKFFFAPMDDMAQLSDSKRLIRICMMVDELRTWCKAYKDDPDTLRNALHYDEFVAIGGTPPSADRSKPYSIARQMTWARRDISAFLERGAFPSSDDVRKSSLTYIFYDSDDESNDEHYVRHREPLLGLKRIQFVLEKAATFAKAHDGAFDTVAAQTAFAAITLTAEEFVACGGHKDKLHHAPAAFGTIVLMAKRELKRWVERAHFPHPRSTTRPLSAEAVVAVKTRWTRCISACPPVFGAPMRDADAFVQEVEQQQRPPLLHVPIGIVAKDVLRGDFVVIDAGCYYRPSEFFDTDDEDEADAEPDMVVDAADGL